MSSKGNGPCNRDRLRTRVKAWEDGAWFREALVAHADKTGRAPIRRRPRVASGSGRLRAGSDPVTGEKESKEWPLWEVFIRGQQVWPTSMWAACTPPTPKWRSNNARDVYTRRNEGVSIWVVRSSDIVASSPSDKGRVVRALEQQDLPPSDLLRDT